MSALDRELMVLRGICSCAGDAAAVDEAYEELNMLRRVLKWFATGNVGSSSRAMACEAVDLPHDKSHPYDPSDFHRCLMLLEAVPEIRQRMDKVAAISGTWAKLVSRWDEVEKCFLDEAGIDWRKSNRAPKTYALMKQVGC